MPDTSRTAAPESRHRAAGQPATMLGKRRETDRPLGPLARRNPKRRTPREGPRSQLTRTGASCLRSEQGTERTRRHHRHHRHRHRHRQGKHLHSQIPRSHDYRRPMCIGTILLLDFYRNFLSWRDWKTQTTPLPRPSLCFRNGRNVISSALSQFSSDSRRRVRRCFKEVLTTEE